LQIVIIWSLLALVLSIALVAITIRICRKNKWISEPRTDRWHKGCPCLFGGVPIWLTVVVLTAANPVTRGAEMWSLIAIASLVFLLGLADDVWRLLPRTKLLIQTGAALLVVLAGIVQPFHAFPVIGAMFGVVWIVGMTNAFNLLDNMDGLAAGIGLISSVYLGYLYVTQGNLEGAVLLGILSGAQAGFLLFNFNPARIFMGDTGSLFIGFVIGTSILAQPRHISGVPAFILLPVLVCAVPIFDTFFVSITRSLRGQPVSQGGTDHSSHRLVRLGLNERSAVLLLYAISLGSGAIAIFLQRFRLPYNIGLIGFWLLFLFVFGIHLFQDQGPTSHTYRGENRLLRRLITRDTLALLLDPIALFLSYYLAYFLRFSSAVPYAEWMAFFYSCSLLIAAKFFFLWQFRVYQRSWWRASAGDIVAMGEALLIGEVVAIAFLIAFGRFATYSQSVLVIDVVLSFALLLVLRYSLSLFSTLVRLCCGIREDAERRVFLIGTSERAATVLKFMNASQVTCVGLIDANGGRDVGRWVWGKRVLGRIDDLARLSTEFQVREVVLADEESIPIPEAQLQEFCLSWNLHFTRFGLYSADEVRLPKGA
jgi:UDP-GlcNAc:undecaprenyl-phosphate/decaprenyl-phosphate GlcNAc-1-phosphate transferase